MNKHDWISWLRERDAHVLLLTLVQAIESPTATLDGRFGIRAMVDGWRAKALTALEADNWQACIDKYIEVWVDARQEYLSDPSYLEKEDAELDS